MTISRKFEKLFLFFPDVACLSLCFLFYAITASTNCWPATLQAEPDATKTSHAKTQFREKTLLNLLLLENNKVDQGPFVYCQDTDLTTNSRGVFSRRHTISSNVLYVDGHAEAIPVKTMFGYYESYSTVGKKPPWCFSE